MSILTFPSMLPAQLEWWLESRTRTFSSPLSGSSQTIEMPGARWAARLSFSDSKEVDGHTLFSFLASLRGESGRFYLSPLHHSTPAGTPSGTPLVNGANADVNATEPIGETTIALANASRSIIAGEYVKFSNHNDIYKVITGGSSTITIEATGLTTEISAVHTMDVYHQGATLKSDGWNADTLILKAGDYVGVNNELKIITADVTSDGTGKADLPIAPILRSTITDNSAITTSNPTAIMRLKDDNQARASYYGPIVTSISFECIEVFT